MAGKTDRSGTRVGHVHMQLRHLDAALVVQQLVAVAPLGIEKLGALDDDLAELNALHGWNILGDDIDAGAQAEDQTCILPVQHEITASKENFARGRNGRHIVAMAVPMSGHRSGEAGECKGKEKVEKKGRAEMICDCRLFYFRRCFEDLSG